MKLEKFEGKMNQWILLLPTLIQINIAFLISSLLVVTIIPSSVALNRQIIEIKNGQSSTKPVARYIELLKKDFRRNIVLGVLYTFLVLFLSLDIALALSGRTMMFKIIAYLFGSLLVVVLFSLQYLIPLLARYNQPIKWYIKTSILMSIKYFRETMLLFFISLFPFVILYVANLFFFTLLLVMIVCGYAISMILQNNVLIKRVFEE
jgi:uncharacterized membrane protein YesL